MGKKYLLIIIGVLVIFIAGVFIIGYFISKEAKEKTTTQSELEEPKIPIPPSVEVMGGAPAPPATTVEVISE